jgi:hypothetical protein
VKWHGQLYSGRLGFKCRPRDRPSGLRCLGATLKVGKIRYRVIKGYIKIHCKLFYLMNLQKIVRNLILRIQCTVRYPVIQFGKLTAINLHSQNNFRTLTHFSDTFCQNLPRPLPFTFLLIKYPVIIPPATLIESLNTSQTN